MPDWATPEVAVICWMPGVFEARIVAEADPSDAVRTDAGETTASPDARSCTVCPACGAPLGVKNRMESFDGDVPSAGRRLGVSCRPMPGRLVSLSVADPAVLVSVVAASVSVCRRVACLLC